MIINSIFIAEKNALTLYNDLKEALPNTNIQMFYEGMATLPETDAYIGFGPVLDFSFNNYKWVHCLGAGVDKFIDNNNLESKTILTRTIDQFGYQIGSFCLSFMLNVEQNLYEYQELQRKKQWNRIGKGTIQNKKVVIFGTGEIGKGIAQMLKFMGAQVIGVSKSGHDAQYFDIVFKTSDFKEAIRDGDWIINILPLTDETFEYFNIEKFKLMQNINFINVGRGKTVNEDDLIYAMNNDHINYAILDVQHNEPLPANSPLYLQERLIITPHISGIPQVNKSFDNIIDIKNKIEQGENLNCKVDIKKQY